ncbi:MAG: hypothetical protein K8S55_05270 [Phycisphaerae bacterium]|nr:hypothetical protein [Phycisphaerae bacterium]
MIRYKCIKCGSTLESSSSMAGQEDKCPVCGQVCVVPKSIRRVLIIISVCGGGFLLLCVVAVVLLNQPASLRCDRFDVGNPPGEPTPPASQPASLRCDRFDVAVVLKGDKLEVSLDTDLPDDTSLMVSVWRTYREKGNTERYIIDYFSDGSAVGRWRGKQVIDVNNEKALRRFHAKREQLAKIDMAGEIESISDSIEVGFTIPVNQPNPAFGNRNKNLCGKMVRQSKSGLRIIEWKRRVPYPLRHSCSK